MKIDRILLLGIVTLAVLIVLVTATLLTRDMLYIAQANLEALETVASSVKEDNAAMFGNLTHQASEIGVNIDEIAEHTAFEQLRNIGEGIAQDIKAVMDSPFLLAQAAAVTLFFAKTEAEAHGEVPSRQWAERYLYDFLTHHDDIRGVFCAWEKNAFDGKDADFIGKENPDKEMFIANPGYVSEGAFLKNAIGSAKITTTLHTFVPGCVKFVMSV